MLGLPSVATVLLVCAHGGRAATSPSHASSLAPPTASNASATAIASSSFAPPESEDEDAAPDFCPATVVSLLSSSSLVVVAQSSHGQVIAKSLGTANRADSSWALASPASGTTLRGGPAAVLLPHGLGIFVAVCDGAGALRGALLRVAAAAAGSGDSSLSAGLSAPAAAPEWGAWHLLGSGSSIECATTPTVVADERSLLHVFAVDTRDGELWHGTWAAELPAQAAMLPADDPVENNGDEAEEEMETERGQLPPRRASSARALADAQALLFASAPSVPLMAWSSLSARVTASPVAAFDSAGTLHLVGRGGSGQLFHRSATYGGGGGSQGRGSGSSGAGWRWAVRWHALDGRVRGSPRLPLRSRPLMLLDLLGRGRADSAAYRVAQAPLRPPREVAWGRRQPLGGVLASAPTAAEDAAGRLHVFGLGPDGTAWHRTLASPDTAAAPRPPSDGEAPSLVTSLPPSLWGSLGGELNSVPLAALRADGTVSVVVGGTDGSLYLKSQQQHGADWGEWRSVGGPIRTFAC